jgi:inhibitor of KinA sporulation pathway (predicted exonuclease)
MNSMIGYNFLSLDLEMNQPSGKVIQVGVAVGNVQSGVLCTRSWFLDPCELIDEQITELTGIDDGTIQQSSVPLEQVALELGNLITEHSCFVNPVQWGGGDARTLLSEFRLANVPFPFFGRREIDVKTVCGYLAMVEGRKPSGGLKSYLGKYGMEFSGTPHRADDDARNTLELWFALMRRQRVLEESRESIRRLK